jgi:hypothetical protein
MQLTTRYNASQFFWLTQRDPAQSSRDDIHHTLVTGPAESVQILMRGDVQTFKDQLWVLLWRQQQPSVLLTIRHSRPALQLLTNASMSFHAWRSRYGCSPYEAVVDVDLDGTSIALMVRRSDLYVCDFLAQAGNPLDAGDLACAMTDEDVYVFAERLGERHPKGFSRAGIRNAVTRLRGAIDKLGFDRGIIRTDQDAYSIDRRLVRIDVRHTKQ